MEILVQQAFWKSKKLLDLLKDQPPQPAFRSALDLLIGAQLTQGKIVKIRGRNFSYVSRDKKSLSFLPQDWCDQLARIGSAWQGCTIWRAGLPLIAFVEMSHKSGESYGEIKLNAEVGPLADAKLRRDLIDSICFAAATNSLARIRFPEGASDKGRLYSRFLLSSSLKIDNVCDANEIEVKIAALVYDFKLEFEVVTSALSRLMKAD